MCNVVHVSLFPRCTVDVQIGYWHVIRKLYNVITILCIIPKGM